MAQLVVRNIEDPVKLRLQRRARRNGRSMEEEIRDILRDAANEEDAPAGGLGTEISALFSKVGFSKVEFAKVEFTKVGLDSGIPELRGHELKPPAFRK